jgi:hypothetical protein
MARAPNPVDTAKLQLSTTPQVVAALDALARTGMFGKNSSEVAEELMRQKLREVLREGWTERPARGRK